MARVRELEGGIFQLSLECDPRIDPEIRSGDPERTYDTYSKQYEAIDGLPFPWQAGIERMINGFLERFNPQGIKNREASVSLDPSFVQRAAERLKLGKK